MPENYLIPLSAISGEFLVNSETLPIAFDPQAANRPDDVGFLISWGYESSSPGWGLSAQAFLNDASSDGEPIILFEAGANATTFGHSLAQSYNGHFVFYGSAAITLPVQYNGLNTVFVDAELTASDALPTNFSIFHPRVSSTDLQIGGAVSAGIGAWVEGGPGPMDDPSQLYAQIYDIVGDDMLVAVTGGTLDEPIRVDDSGLASPLAQPSVAITEVNTTAAVVWPGTGFQLNGRIFDTLNGSNTDEFAISPPTHIVGLNPVIEATANGYLVIWSADGGEEDDSGSGIYGQFIGLDGSMQGTVFPINSHTESDQENPEVATLDDGSLIVVWDSLNQDGSSQGIFAQRLTGGGEKFGDEFQVNTFVDGIQEAATVSAIGGGAFVVAWESGGQGITTDIYARVFEPDEGTIVLSSAGESYSVPQGAGSIFALGGDDTVIGHSGPDILFGHAGNDQLLGEGGNDSLGGGPDFDTLIGGMGDDRLEGDDGDDSLDGGIGNDGLLGGAGNDTLNGGDGDDNLAASTGEDVLRGGAGRDQMGGGIGDDTMEGGGGCDFMGGGQGDDDMSGGDGGDVVNGGPGNDSLRGGAGDDTMGASFGNDTVLGNDGADELGGGTGRDSLMGSIGNDSIGGGEGDDTVDGGDGDDFLAGGGRNDLIDGGTGDDAINGGDGDDTMTGGAGADQFIFNGFITSDVDLIVDYEDGLDTFRMTGIANAPGTGLQGRVDALAITDTVIDGQAGVTMTYEGHVIEVIGVGAADLGVEDFVFV